MKRAGACLYLVRGSTSAFGRYVKTGVCVHKSTHSGRGCAVCALCVCVRAERCFPGSTPRERGGHGENAAVGTLSTMAPAHRVEELECGRQSIPRARTRAGARIGAFLEGKLAPFLN